MTEQKPVMIRDKHAVSVIRRWQRKIKPKLSLDKIAAALILDGDAKRKAGK